MPAERPSAEEIARRGKDLYERAVKVHVERQHQGKFLVIDLESGDYEVDADDIEADSRLRQRQPNSLFYLMRIRHPGAFRVGWSGGLGY